MPADARGAFALQEIAAASDIPADFVDAVRAVEKAGESIRSKDAGPYIDSWSPTDDCTLFGAWGPIEKGFDRLRSTFTWVATRFTGAQVRFTYATIDVAGDLGVTVGFESGRTSVDDGAPDEMVIRVTQVYRKSGGRWLLVHRHADFAPPDERLAPAGD